MPRGLFQQKKRKKIGVGGGGCGASVCDSEFSSVSVPWVSEPGFAM